MIDEIQVRSDIGACKWVDGVALTRQVLTGQGVTNKQGELMAGYQSAIHACAGLTVDGLAPCKSARLRASLVSESDQDTIAVHVGNTANPLSQQQINRVLNGRWP